MEAKRKKAIEKLSQRRDHQHIFTNEPKDPKALSKLILQSVAGRDIVVGDDEESEVKCMVIKAENNLNKLEEYICEAMADKDQLIDQ